jgi:hypothetical protein
MRANSVLGNAKSNRHQKTHRVEPDGTGRKFTHLTRGGLRRESAGGVSKGHSSEESRGNPAGAKDLRVGETRIASSPLSQGREGLRNEPGVTTTVATRFGAKGTGGWNPVRVASAGAESDTGRWKGKR